MNPSTSQIVKQQNTSCEENNINYCLNDDCLLIIFEYLPLLDKLNIEFVCKKWNRLAKQTWINVKTLKICKDKVKTNYSFFSNSRDNTNFIVNVTKRCGRYLNYLTIKNDLEVDYQIIIPEIINNCKNLNFLKLKEYGFLEATIFSDEDEESMNLLFKNNKKLKNILIDEAYLKANSLLYLNPEIITEVSMLYLDFEENNNYLTFFSKLKNVQKFEVYLYNNITDMIKALNDSGCENMHEFSTWGSNDTISVHQLLTFIKKQKSLSKFQILNFEADKNFLEILPTELENLKITIDENTSYCLRWFENLTSLHCKIFHLNDQCIKNIAKCVNLKNFFLWVHTSSSLTSEGENYFAKFKKLESFGLLINFAVDNIIKAITQCKDLKKLDIGNCACETDDCIDSISSFKDLKFLNVSGTDISENQLINLVTNLIKLEKLKINECEFIKFECLENINSIKLERNDNHILKIYFNHELYCKNVNESNVDLENLNLLSIRVLED